MDNSDKSLMNSRLMAEVFAGFAGCLKAGTLQQPTALYLDSIFHHSVSFILFQPRSLNIVKLHFRPAFSRLTLVDFVSVYYHSGEVSTTMGGH